MQYAYFLFLFSNLFFTTKFSHLKCYLLAPFSTVPILLAGIQKQCSVKCLAQEHNIVVILARRSPTPY